MKRIISSPLNRILIVLGLVFTNGTLFMTQRANAIPDFLGKCNFCWDMEGKLAHCCTLECDLSGYECNCNGARDCSVQEQ